VPIIFLISPLFIGISWRISIGLALFWMAIWTIMRLNGV
jgi:hypothetical protein